MERLPRSYRGPGSNNQLNFLIMPTEVNIFALFNSLNARGAVRLSECTVDKVGTSPDAIAASEPEKSNNQ